MLGNFFKYKSLNRGNKNYFLFPLDEFDPSKEYILLVTRYVGDQPRTDLHYTWTTELTDVITDNMKSKKKLIDFFYSKKVGDLRKAMITIDNLKHTSIAKREKYDDSDSETVSVEWDVYNLKEYIEQKKYMSYISSSEYISIFDLYEFTFKGEKYASSKLIRGIEERSLIDDDCIRDRQSLFIDGDNIDMEKVYIELERVGKKNGIL